MQKSRLAIVVSTPRGRLLCLALLAGSALTGPLAHAAPMAGRGGLIGGLPTQFASSAGAAAQLTPGLYEPVGAALGGPGLIARPIAVVAAPSSVVAVVLPTGGTVMAGAASIGAASGGALSITQSSAKAIIDWGSFSIGSGGTVSFQSGSGATLNRVTGASVSAIDGLLSATGSVYLINPNGVIVGKTGVVNVGGSFVASTLDVDNAAFLAGGPLTFAGPSTASVVNLGKVGSLGGDVALIATTVANAGSISAANGAAGLLSGSSVVMTDASLDGGRFAVALPAAGGGVTNSGAIAAATAELRANGGDVYALAGDTAGVIRATGVSAGGGKIWLVAEGGTAHVAGTLEAQGANGAPGQIETSGQVVDVGAAAIDAHGGTWTLDPTNLTIDATAATTISNALATSDVVEQTTATAASGTGNQAAGAGDIILASGASISWSSAKALTLSAYHDVNLLGTISDSGTGVLTLRADNAATGSGTVKLTGTNGQVTLGSGAAANIFYNPTSYTDTATRSTQQGVAIPQVEIYTNPYTNPYAGSNSGQQQATSAPVMGGTARAYMLVNGLNLLGGGLTGVGSQLNGLYALNVDIDASSTKTANPVPGMTGTYYGFVPIGYTGNGNTTNSFIGVFDGQGHTISNLYINHFTLDSNNNKQNVDATGLFGFVTGGDAAATFVRNLNVLNATVIGSGAQSGIVAGGFQGNAVGSNLVTSGTVMGYRSGGVAGQLYSNGSIQNSSSSATINANNVTDESGGLVGENYGGFVSGSFATGAVMGGAYVGGLVGSDNGAITNSYATGKVTASGSHVGGLSGSLFGTATNDYATGSVTITGLGVERVGGLAGDGGGTWTNVYATGSVTDTAGGGNQIGGLIGRSDVVTLINSYTTGAVTIANPNNDVGSFGGLIGRAQPGYSVTNSFATGAVNSGGGANVGGLIGTSFAGTVSTSYASGAVNGISGVGGLIGGATDYGSYAAGLTVTDSYATGSVTGTGTATNASTSYIGGLVGRVNHDEGTTGATTTITRTYATGLVSGQAVQGGLVGGNIGVISNSIWDRTSTGQANGVGGAVTYTTSNPAITSVTNLTSVQDTTPGAADYAFSATPYTNAGFLFGVTPGQMLNVNGTQQPASWVQIDADSTLNARGGSAVSTRPILLMEYAPSIKTAHQLQLMALSTGASYTLAADIDARGTATLSDVWGPQGFVSVAQNGYATTSYAGLFEGAGHAITGLTEAQPANSTSPLGLFGSVGAAGAVQNVALVGGAFSGGAQSFAGSIATYNAGTITNVSSSASVSGRLAGGLVGSNAGTITKSSSSGIVTGYGEAGGLVGGNDGTISSSTASGAVTDVNTTVASTSGTGGLVGLDTGSLINDVATGTVTSLVDPAAGGLVGLMVGGSITGSSASGAVVGARDVGGLVGTSVSSNGATGSTPGGSISNSFASGAVKGSTEVGGLVGSSTTNIVTSYATGSVTGSQGEAGGLVGTLGFGFYNGGQYVATTSTDSYATGNVTGNGYVGGLVGLLQPSSGIVGSAANLSYAKGTVGATPGSTFGQYGGLVGAAFGGAVTNSYATGAVSGPLGVGGLVGQMGYGFLTVSGKTTYYFSSVAGSHASGAAVSTGGLVGGLVGENDSGSITDSFAMGAVSGVNQVGGLVGGNLLATFVNQGPGTVPAPSITGSAAGKTYASGSVTGTGTATGGLVGENAGTITQAAFAPTGAGVVGATYVGGLVGLNDPGSSITNGSSSGAVTGTGYVGGLVGDNFGALATVSETGAVSGAGGTGGLIGVNEGGATVSVAAVTGNVTGAGNDVGGIAGANFGTLTKVGVSGSKVTGVDHTGGLVGYNSGAVTGAADGSVVGRDYTGGQIGLNYSALTLSGAGITGLQTAPNGLELVNGRTYVGGLVGWNAAPGTLTGAVAYATTSATGDYVGGVAGVNKGTLTGVRAAGGATSGARYVGALVGLNQGAISGASATVQAIGDLYVGGLVGWNDTGATIVKSYATGAVTGRASGAEAGTNNDYVGGLIGVNFGSASDVCATGAVSGVQVVGGLVGTNMPGGASITRAYATGAVTASGGAAGGVAGVQAGTLTNTYFQASTTGQSGGAGYTTANATGAPTAIGPGTTYDANAQATYQGFDFTNTWQVNTGSPPTLKGVTQ